MGTKLFLALALLASACGGSDFSGQATACPAGEQVECACTGGTKGAQVCRDDGMGFGACDCGGGSEGDAAPLGSGTTGGSSGGMSTTGGGSTTGSGGTTNAGTTGAVLLPDGGVSTGYVAQCNEVRAGADGNPKRPDGTVGLCNPSGKYLTPYVCSATGPVTIPTQCVLINADCTARDQPVWAQLMLACSDEPLSFQL